MIVWLWDAHGPDRAELGVTDDEGRAQQATEAWMRGCQATAGRVELAQLVTGFAALTSDYQRTGQGWTARPCREGRIRWVPLPATGNSKPDGCATLQGFLTPR